MIASVVGSSLGRKLIGAGIIGILLWIAWAQIGSLKRSVEVLEAENEALRAATLAQSAAIDTVVSRWEDYQVKVSATVDHIQRTSNNAQKEVRKLERIFAKHDLDRIARRRPNTVERLLNSGTARSFRMFEQATSGDTDDSNRPATGNSANPVPETR